MAALTPDDLALHADFVRRLAQSLLASPDLADDAAQETLVLAWQKQPQVENPRGWLTQVLRNVVRNLRRGETRRQVREEQAAPRSASHTPEAILAREETRTRLLHAALALPDAEREAVLLRYSEGQAPRQIAADLGVPVHTVHNRLRSGLARMRVSLDQSYGDDGREWRGALATLVPTLLTRAAPVGIGGLLVTKNLIALAAVALLALGGWLAVRAASMEDPAGSEQGAGLEGSASETAAAPELQAHGDLPATDLPEPAAGGRRLAGRVLDHATKAPVVGVEVTAFDHGRLVSLTATTDAAGHFEFRDVSAGDGAFHVVVAHPDHAPNVVPGAGAAAGDLTLVRNEGGWIGGRLVDTDSTPIRRFRVRALRRLLQPKDEYDQDRMTSYGILPESMTVDRTAEVDDATGAFRIGPLRPGIHVILIDVQGAPPMLEAQGAAYYERAKGIVVRAGETTEVGSITAPRLGHIEVKVLDAASELPLDAVEFTVGLAMNGREYGTPVAGVERVASGAYRVPVASRADGRLENATLTAHRKGYGRAELNPGGHRNGRRFVRRIVRTGGVRLTLLQPDGEPMVGATTILRSGASRRPIQRSVVDAEGLFAADDVPAGIQLELVVLDTATLTILRVFPLALEPGEMRTMTLGGPDQTALHGFLRHKGAPIHRALISLDTPGGRRTQVWTSRVGEYRFDGLEPGAHEITVSLDEPDVVLEGSFVLTDGAVFELPIHLDHRIAGTTTWKNPKAGDSGLGNPRLLAKPVAGEGFAISSRLANDGSFDFYVPTTEAYTLESAFSGHAVLGAPRVTAGESSTDLHLRVEKDPADGEAVFRILEVGTGAEVPDATFRYRFRTTRGGGIPVEGHVRDTRLDLGRHAYIFRSPVHLDLPLTIEISETEKRVERTVELVRANAIEIVGFSATSRAKDAGLAKGDILLSYAGTRVRNVPALVAAIKRSETSDVVTVQLLRDGSPKTLDIPGGRMGVRLANRRVEE